MSKFPLESVARHLHYFFYEIPGMSLKRKSSTVLYNSIQIPDLERITSIKKWPCFPLEAVERCPLGNVGRATQHRPKRLIIPLD